MGRPNVVTMAPTCEFTHGRGIHAWSGFSFSGRIMFWWAGMGPGQSRPTPIWEILVQDSFVVTLPGPMSKPREVES